MHKYIIMGVQGSGKGTQAKRLHEDYSLVHISVGDHFRWHIQSHTKLGARIKRIVARGELVPDEVVGQEVRWRLDQHDWNYGFILDGFPRNRVQAEFFLESYDIDAVIQIDVPDEVVIRRIMGRRLCKVCGTDYNLLEHNPQVPDQCDICHGPLVMRADDNEEAIAARLRDYHTKTEPTLELFAKKVLVVRANGRQPADEVYQEIRRGLGLA